MREALFEEVKAHEPHKFVEQLQDAFNLVSEQVIDAPMTLAQADLKPDYYDSYAYKTKPERRLALEQQDQFDLMAQFQIYVFQKK